VNMLPNILSSAPFFVLAAAAFAASTFSMCRMLRSFVLAYERTVSTK
jgi:hypothetical protein